MFEKVSKAIEDSARPNEILKRENLVEGLGTHYVRRVSYGAQMVASIKLDFPANAARYVQFPLYFKML